MVEKGESRRLQAARLRVGPPEPHADNTCRGGGGASAGQTGARGGSAGGAGAGGSEARCHVRGRRGRGLDHAISKRPATQRGGGGWTTQRSLRPSREKTSRTTRATFSKRGRGSPSTPVSAGGRSFEEGFNAVLAGRAGHGAEGGGEAHSARPRGSRNREVEDWERQFD